MSRLTKGYLIAVVGTVIWSMSATFIRYLTVNYQVPPFVIGFWRDLFTALAIFLFLLIFARQYVKFPKGHLRILLIYGFTLSMFNAMWIISVWFNGAAVSTVLAYSSTAFTAIAGRIFYRERLDWVKILAVIASITGCIFVAGAYDLSAWKLNTLGITTGLLSGLGFGIYSMIGKLSARRGINPWTAMIYTFLIAATFLLLFNSLPIKFPGIPSQPSIFWLQNAWIGWALLVALAILSTVGGYGLYNVSLTLLPASIANLIASMEPAFTAVQSYLLLGERFTFAQVGGSLLIIGGVIFLRIMESRNPEV